MLHNLVGNIYDRMGNFSREMETISQMEILETNNSQKKNLTISEMKNAFSGLRSTLDTAEKHGKVLQKLFRLKYKEKKRRRKRERKQRNSASKSCGTIANSYSPRKTECGRKTYSKA